MAAVKASSSNSFFALFDLPERFRLDAAELETRYREKSRRWHPDRFSRAPASERAEVLQRATMLNEAYRTLRSDGKRAEYLLKLRGAELGEDAPKTALDPDFLMQILEWREELSDAVAERDVAKIAALKKIVESAHAQLAQQMADGFEQLEHGDATAISQLTTLYYMQRYYQRFSDEILVAEDTTAPRSAVL